MACARMSCQIGPVEREEHALAGQLTSISGSTFPPVYRIDFFLFATGNQRAGWPMAALVQNDSQQNEENDCCD
jgi:hypothetical protein